MLGCGVWHPQQALGDTTTLLGSIEGSVLHFITNVYDAIEWPGVVLLMAIESACIPLPSEIIMPLAGWMLIKDRGYGPEWLIVAGLLGALGNTLGSLVAYYAGAMGGRRFVGRYGKYILISPHDLDLADRWFKRWGAPTVFFSRLLPVVRTFISFPAGVSEMPVGRFTAYTFAGAFPWSVGLAAAGYALGSHWQHLRDWMRPADIPILIIVALLIGWYVYRHVKRAWAPAPETIDR